MMKRTRRTTNTPSETIEIDPAFQPVADAFARDRLVTCGKMMSAVGLKVNGKIFAMMSRGNLVVKIPKARVDALVAAGRGKNFDPGHGRLMKEWIAVPPGKARWDELAKEAYEFVKRGAK
jgi:TfoX N-terminal domain